MPPPLPPNWPCLQLRFLLFCSIVCVTSAHHDFRATPDLVSCLFGFLIAPKAASGAHLFLAVAPADRISVRGLAAAGRTSTCSLWRTPILCEQQPRRSGRFVSSLTCFFFFGVCTTHHTSHTQSRAVGRLEEWIGWRTHRRLKPQVLVFVFCALFFVVAARRWLLWPQRNSRPAAGSPAPVFVSSRAASAECRKTTQRIRIYLCPCAPIAARPPWRTVPRHQRPGHDPEYFRECAPLARHRAARRDATAACRGNEREKNAHRWLFFVSPDPAVRARFSVLDLTSDDASPRLRPSLRKGSCGPICVRIGSLTTRHVSPPRVGSPPRRLQGAVSASSGYFVACPVWFTTTRPHSHPRLRCERHAATSAALRTHTPVR